MQKSGYEEGQVAMVRQVMDAAVLGLKNAHIDHEILGEYTCTYMNRDSDFIKYAGCYPIEDLFKHMKDGCAYAQAGQQPYGTQ
jgi:hypothetical protein